jgi:hypothetical protein
MNKLIKISFLFIVLFLTIPALADGDMGAGGRPPKVVVKAPESTDNAHRLDSATGEKDAFGSLFSWIYQQVFELID